MADLGTASIHWSDSLPEFSRELVGDDFFACGPWFQNLQQTVAMPAVRPSFLIISGHDGKAVLPLTERRGNHWPECRSLESMDNFYSCGFGPIVASAQSEAMTEPMLAALAEQSERFDVVRIGPIDRQLPLWSGLEQFLNRSGFKSEWLPAFGNWYANTESLSHQDYLGRVSSKFPGICHKRKNAFLRKHPGALSIYQGGEGLERAIDNYQKVYQDSWKRQEPYPDFMPGLIRLAAERGWLRLGQALVDGEVAATQLWLVYAGKALIYKVAYVDRFANLSIGSILTSMMFEHVLDVDHVSEIDFLSGDDDYKRKWMFERRERHTLYAFNVRRVRGALAAARHLAGGYLKRLSDRSAADRRQVAGQPYPKDNSQAGQHDLVR